MVLKNSRYVTVSVTSDSVTSRFNGLKKIHTHNNVVTDVTIRCGDITALTHLGIFKFLVWQPKREDLLLCSDLNGWKKRSKSHTIHNY